MIGEAQVKAKSDDELLNIWINQTDYVAELVALVKAEIDKRNLELSGARVVTSEEKEERSKRQSVLSTIRFISFLSTFRNHPVCHIGGHSPKYDHIVWVPNTCSNADRSIG